MDTVSTLGVSPTRWIRASLARALVLALLLVLVSLGLAAWFYFAPSSLLKLVLRSPSVEKFELAGSAASGTVIDLQGGWFNEGKATDIVIRSLRKGGSWDVSERITIRNGRLRGGIRIVGLGRNGEAPRVRESSVSEGHTERAQAAAPRQIVLENLQIEAAHRIPLYLGPGVTGVTVKDCTFTGWTVSTAVYLDAESAGNTIENCTFDVRAAREVIAVDGSARNIIKGNLFVRAAFGGIYLYRNCGECGTVRHQTPRENRIDNNTFDLSGLRPRSYGIWLGSRQERRNYCEADAGHSFGSSADNRDFADDNMVTGNVFNPASSRANRDDGERNLTEERPPNIVFILADDVSACELSPYGGTIAMPNLQKLADDGVLIRDAWSTPVCAPSRAMMMTGKYPHHTGYYENPVSPEVPFWQDPRHLPLLKMLKQAGYATSMVGKKHPGNDPDAGVLGADDWLITWFWLGHNGPRQNHWSPDRQDMYGVSWFWHPGLVRNGQGLPTTPKDFGPDLELKHLLEFAAVDRDKPFIAYWATFRPHKAHEEVAGSPEGRWYYTDVPELDKEGRPTGGKVRGTLKSNMQYLDHLLGRLREGLAKQGRAKDTIIFFAADNGTADIRGHNEVMDKNSYDRDNGIRVPLVVGGGPVQARGTSDVLVDFTDFWPTFAQLAGYRGTMKTDGHSFAPYLLGEPFTPRETIRMAMNNARWVRDRDWLLDGRGRFYDTRGAANRDEYRDVSESTNTEAIAARKRFEMYLQEIPLPDINDPATAKLWRQFRATPQGAPVEVFRPSYLK